MIEEVASDVLIVGMGAAGQLAALNAYDADPDLNIQIVTKALKGKGGCSRMVQGGFNVVLDPRDSHEKHLMDTLKGGRYINDQELARTLVEEATPSIKEMETRYGCFFDRNPDGTIHQKPFAGQSFDRTVHKGDLTGIEIVSRITEQVLKRNITVLEECRAVELLCEASARRVTGALLFDIKRGRFVVARARCTVMASGGGPTQYRFHAPGPEKSVDGLAMLYRSGARMRDMEMVQFHPTGLIVPGSVMAGSLLEEGLRGSGAYLFNGHGERFMQRYAPEAMERATRDIVSRSIYLEMTEGRACLEGGVHIDASHLGADFVRENFPGMCDRCSQFGLDLARERVPVSPTAHYHMGGAAIDSSGQSSLEGLFVAGEDSGGVHGANRLGGNGICDSVVFGRQTGKAVARYLSREPSAVPETAPDLVADAIERYSAPEGNGGRANVFDLRDALREINWTRVGVVRNAADLAAALGEIETLAEETRAASVLGDLPYNMEWLCFIDLLNMIDTSRMVAESSLRRSESRGSHYRADHPDQDDAHGLFNLFLSRGDDGRPAFEQVPVEFKHRDLKTCQSYGE
ncbi:MAG: FAD-binding protein [Candidatus Latescibacteria bacterium]|jgi:succinate dehydrogenase / fumarate reductase flavoprotein subunit/fumarate reductase flavoprotein subunit|nr:FAD-binding protein [Candidatus Latescibacterota bacterium]